MVATASDIAALTVLLGRTPLGAFEVVVRDAAGAPIVIRNSPLLDDGTPMPTRYWLVDRALVTRVSRIESGGGVRAAEAAVDREALARAHVRYASERDAVLPERHAGPRPHGGVGGTSRGVKCLHAHYAWHLAGGDDPVGRWVAAELARGEGTVTRVAAVDVGTNSCRLLVAEVDGGRLTTVDRRTQITRLGQGVNQTRRLDPEAIARTIKVIEDYQEAIAAHGVGRVRVAATSASRDAVNRDEFFDPVEQLLGVRPELLSGEEEARLEFSGATAGLSEPEPYLVVDVGGGSTEFIVGVSEPDGLISIDVGCVRLTEQFLHSDPPSAEELSVAVSVVRDHLADVDRGLQGAAGAKTLIGTAGTVWTMGAIELGVDASESDRIDHFRLSRAAAEEIFRTLATEPIARRRHNPGLDPGRVDVIVGGVIVVVSVMRHWGFDEMLVSEADILDGLARSIA